MSENKGASNSVLAFLTFSCRDFANWILDERVLAAARSDNEDLLLEVFEQGDFDINCQDGYVLACRRFDTPKLIQSS